MDYSNLLSKLTPNYLGGLYDGDGSIYIGKIKDGYQLGVSFTQCIYNICHLLQIKYGGNIYKDSKVNENSRVIYYLRISGKDCYKILKDLEIGSILKNEQVKLALDFLNHIKKENNDEKHQIYEKIKYLNNNKNPENINFNYEKLDYDYFSGLFDSEGSVSIEKNSENEKLTSCRLKLTQKSNNEILNKIINFLGDGKIDEYSWVSYSPKMHYVKELYDRCIIKKEQLKNLIIFIKTIKQSQIYTDELHLIRKKCYDNIQKEKHQNTNIDDEIITENNIKIKEIFDNKKKEKKLEEEKIKEEERKENKILLSIIKSEQMSGPNNPNYGIERPKEHSDKISKSTFGKKRILTDEIILQIYSYKDSDLTQKEVADKFGVSRGTVGEIYEGKKVISSEYEKHIGYKEEKKNKDEEFEKFILEYYPELNKKEIGTLKTNLSKRFLTGREMVLIWYYGMLRDKNIATPFGKKIETTSIIKYLKDNKNKEITKDVIKNIWNYKTKLYKFDFKDNELNLTYEHWINKTIDGIELKFIDF
jgi:transcriptional regulator with XRE-family HTH domain